MKERKNAAVAQDGFALIVTLLIISILVVLILEFNRAVRGDLIMAGNFRDETKAYYLAKSGVNAAIALLQADDNQYDALTEEWALEKPPVPLGEGIVFVKITDESGKINLNSLVVDLARRGQGQTGSGQQSSGPQTTATGSPYPGANAAARSSQQSQQGQQGQQGKQGAGLQDDQPDPFQYQLLKRLFDALEIDVEAVDALVDWIDKNNDIYEGRGAEDGVKNGVLNTIAELRMVKGFTDETLTKLGVGRIAGMIDMESNRYLTVHSYPDGKININTANQLALQSLHDDLSSDIADRIIETRKEDPFETVDALRQVIGDQKIFDAIKGYVTVKSDYYSVESYGVVNDIRKRIVALLKKDQGTIKVVYWKVE